jgi:hypothetical protein
MQRILNSNDFKPSAELSLWAVTLLITVIHASLQKTFLFPPSVKLLHCLVTQQMPVEIS